MHCNRVFSFLSVILFLTHFSEASISEIKYSSLASLALNCDTELNINGSNDKAQDQMMTSSLCGASGDYPKCIGIQCNSSKSDCQMVQKKANTSIHCLVHPSMKEANILLRTELIEQEQEEFLLVELKHEQFLPGSVQGAPSISMPPSHPTRLQTQYGNDILTCAETDGQCWLWTQKYNSWLHFPALVANHSKGAMTIIGDKPIVVGGENPADETVNGVVEIFDKETFRWIYGPTLEPARRTPGIVPLDDNSLIVVGGIATTFLSSVKMLNLNANTWNDLDNLPISVYVPVCGSINVTYILCIGGGQTTDVFNTAFGLDLSLSNPLWERKPLFDTEEPIAMGFILNLNERLFCLSSYGHKFEKSRKLRRLFLNDPNPTWEVIKEFPQTYYHFMSAYITQGYTIKT